MKISTELLQQLQLLVKKKRQNIVQRHDSHQIPFLMDIDFNEVVAALKEINYKKEHTLFDNKCEK